MPEPNVTSPTVSDILSTDITTPVQTPVKPPTEPSRQPVMTEPATPTPPAFPSQAEKAAKYQNWGAVPEYFTGYKQSAQGWANQWNELDKRVYRLSVELGKVGEQLSQITKENLKIGFSLRSVLETGMITEEMGDTADMIKQRNMRAAIATELDEAATQANRAQWMYQAYNLIPRVLATTSHKTNGDLYSALSGPWVGLTGEQRVEFNRVADEIRTSMREGLVKVGGDPDNPSYDKIVEATVNAMKTVPRPVLVDMNSLSVNEILKSLRTTTAPQTVTEGDLEKVFSQYSIDPETAKQINDEKEITANILDMLKMQQQNIADAKLGLRSLIEGKVGFWESVKIGASSPLVTAMQTFEVYMDNVIRPIAGIEYDLMGKRLFGRKIVSSVPFVGPLLEKLPSSADSPIFQSRYGQAKSEGKNFWQAYSYAWEHDTSISGLSRFMYEIGADPMLPFGFGAYSKMIGLGAKLPYIGSKLATMSSFGYALENSWNMFWDVALFNRIKYGVLLKDAEVGIAERLGFDFMKGWTKEQHSRLGKIPFIGTGMADLPKTAFGQAQRISLDAARKLMADISIANPGVHPYKADLEVLKKRYTGILKGIEAGVDGTPEAMVAVEFTRQELPDIKDVQRVFARLGSKLEVGQETVFEFWQVVENIKGMPFAKSGKYDVEQGADLIRRLTGMDTTEALDAARTVLNNYQKDSISKAIKVVNRAETVPDLVGSMFDTVNKALWNSKTLQMQNHIALQGLIHSTFDRLTWGAANFMRNKFDRWAVTPFAKMNLAFGAYGPFNIIESYIKLAFAGVDMHPSRWDYSAANLLHISWGDMILPPDVFTATTPGGVEAFTEVVAGNRGVEPLSKAAKQWQRAMTGWKIGDWTMNRYGIVGTNLKSYFMHQRSLANLAEIEPVILRQAAGIIDSEMDRIPQEILNLRGMSPKELRDLMYYKFLNSAEAVENLADDINGTLLGKGGKKAKRQFNKPGTPEQFENITSAKAVLDLVEANGDLPIFIKENFVYKAHSGELWKGNNIDKEAADSADELIKYHLNSPTEWNKHLINLATELLAMPTENVSQLMSKLIQINNSVYKASDGVSKILEQALKHRNVGGKEGTRLRDEFMDGVWNRLGQYLDTSESVFNKMIEDVTNSLPKLKLSARREAAVLDMLDSFQQNVNTLKAIRKRQHEVEREYIQLHPGKRTGEWWNGFYAAREPVWNEGWQALANPMRRLAESNVSVDMAFGKFAVPPKIDATGRNLTTVDIANLFLGHPKDMSPIDFTDMTLMRKGTFVDIVLTRARSMASGGGSMKGGEKAAAELGWTGESVGKVYDQMLVQLKLDTMSDEAVAPQLKMIENIRQGLLNIKATKGLSQQSYDTFRQVLKDVADQLRQIDGYAAMPQKAPAVAGKEPIKPSVPEAPVEAAKSAAPPPDIEGALADLSSILDEGKKGASLKSLEAKLGTFSDDAVDGLDELKTSIADYRGISRQGLTPEDYIAEKEAAWEAIVSALDDLTVADVSLEAKPVIKPSVEGVSPSVPSQAASTAIPPLETVPPAPTPGISDRFRKSKQLAVDRATLEYSKVFADYNNANISSSVMRAIYPFWHYEAHRWMWLGREAVNHPGMFTAWGTYQNNTDMGYLPILGTAFEINLARGMIFMGGMRRLIMRDFPEFYDQFPALSESLDWLSRGGFYPAAWVSGVQAVAFTTGGGFRLGDFMPAWIKTPIDALLAVAPNSAAVRKLQENIMPDRSRNMGIAMLVGEEAKKRGMDVSGPDILSKITSKIPLTKDEEAVWIAASKRFAKMDMLLQQAGVLRVRSEGFRMAKEELAQVIEDATGLTKDEQKLASLMGYNVSDLIGGMSKELLWTIQELDKSKYYSNLWIDLYPAEFQEVYHRQQEFWTEVVKQSQVYLTKGVKTSTGTTLPSKEEIASQWKAGLINGGQWLQKLSKIQSAQRVAFDTLADSTRFRDIPISLYDIERADGTVRPGTVTLLEKFGRESPVRSPDRMLADAYFLIRPEERFDPASESYYTDWETYYAQIDALLGSLDEGSRATLVEIINHSKEDIEKKYWVISREKFAAYNRVSSIVLETYTEEDKRLIRRFSSASPTERTELKLMNDVQGNSIIGKYQSEVSTFRKNMRLLDPELDGYLLLFNKTPSLADDNHRWAYDEAVRELGVKG